MNISDSQIRRYLQEYNHVAVVGLTNKTIRPSYQVSEYLQRAGYTIIPINSRLAGETILGRPVYASLAEAQEAGEVIEIVDVFRRSADVPPVAAGAVQVGAKVLWLQMGIVSSEAEQLALAAGIEFVQDRCLKVDHARLMVD